jgi:hypothetical protein
MKTQQHQSGFLMMFVIVFGSIFLTIIGAFLGYVITQYSEQVNQYGKEQALSVAEAGLNYYKWYLAHNPDDTTNGTGLPGPYTGIYEDPEDGPIGEYSLEIASSTACGEAYAIDITSTGTLYDNPDVGRRVTARYARPTIAEYAYIINSNVWAGSDRVIVGPYHSNGGVRMDGRNNSTVSSGQATWSCTSTFGCSPTQTRDGVFTTTANANPDLFSYPSTPINFTGITVDLAQMQDKAQNHGGRYFGPSGRQGYHVIFKSNGTFDVRRVNSKQNEPNGYAWGRYMHILNGTTFIGNYPIPSACSVLYFEDQIWLEGVVNGKVTIAAADVDTAGRDPSVILNNNITYANDSSGILVIGEYDVIIGLVVPNNMVLNGIFIAQNGRFGRNHYDTSMPNAWEQYILRNSLTLNGTIVSNAREGTKWVSDTGVYLSGFNNRYNSYDRDLVADPPPLTPDVSDEYEFIEWREEN